MSSSKERNILPTRLSRKMELVLALNLAMRKVAKLLMACLPTKIDNKPGKRKPNNSYQYVNLWKELAIEKYLKV